LNTVLRNCLTDTFAASVAAGSNPTILLDLMGGVALLLWGLHMVQSGILRAFGSDLRYLLSKALGNRFAALPPVLGKRRIQRSSLHYPQ
jgi:hypothetical protein